MSKLPRESRENYALGVQQGAVEVTLDGISLVCEDAVREFRRRTGRLDY